MDEVLEEILLKVREERVQQDKKWGVQNHPSLV